VLVGRRGKLVAQWLRDCRHREVVGSVLGKGAVHLGMGLESELAMVRLGIAAAGEGIALVVGEGGIVGAEEDSRLGVAVVEMRSPHVEEEEYCSSGMEDTALELADERDIAAGEDIAQLVGGSVVEAGPGLRSNRGSTS